MTARPLVSVHAVDITSGVPAAGLRMTLHRRQPGGPVLLASGTADAHGKMAFGPEILHERDLPCSLTLVMDLAAYFRGRGEVGFVTEVPFNFSLPDASCHYHLPAKITPAGLSLFITRSAQDGRAGRRSISHQILYSELIHMTERASRE